MFGPRKPRCVDFIRQTLRKRYDFFDRFRSFEHRVRLRHREVAKWLGWLAGWLGWLAGRFIVIFIFIKDVASPPPTAAHNVGRDTEAQWAERSPPRSRNPASRSARVCFPTSDDKLQAYTAQRCGSGALGISWRLLGYVSTRTSYSMYDNR